MTLPHREVYLPGVHTPWQVEGLAKNYDLILIEPNTAQEIRFNFDNATDRRHIHDSLPFLKRLGYSVYIEKVRDAKPRETKPQDKSMESVTFETYDELFDGETHPRLIEFHTEHRMVYSNSKGRFIKTRGSGNVKLTRDNPALVQYQWRRQVWGGQVRGRVLRAVPPEKKI
jgi:hypothetical protein